MRRGSSFNFDQLVTSCPDSGDERQFDPTLGFSPFVVAEDVSVENLNNTGLLKSAVPSPWQVGSCSVR